MRPTPTSGRAYLKWGVFSEGLTRARCDACGHDLLNSDHDGLTTTLRYMHLSPSARDQAIALLNRREFYGNVTAPEAEEVCK